MSTFTYRTVATNYVFRFKYGKRSLKLTNGAKEGCSLVCRDGSYYLQDWYLSSAFQVRNQSDAVTQKDPLKSSLYVPIKEKSSRKRVTWEDEGAALGYVCVKNGEGESRSVCIRNPPGVNCAREKLELGTWGKGHRLLPMYLHIVFCLWIVNWYLF